MTNVNDHFEWKGSDATTRIAVIPAGQYDPIGFAASWQLAANSVGGPDVFTITFDISTKKFTFTTNNAITPKWVSGSTTDINISYPAGFFNDVLANETTTTAHISDMPNRLVPTHYLLRSQSLGAGRKSSGGGGGTQIASPQITSAPANYLIAVPNQVMGTAINFVYMSGDEKSDTFEFNEARQIDQIDLRLCHPKHLEVGEPFFSLYDTITYEIEFVCLNQYK